jgi:hypothetical protein
MEDLSGATGPMMWTTPGSTVAHVNGAGRGEPARMRLAELVAALSLGVDLGFGQPMEHVLRQCMIALRLADFVGLDDEDRSVVYYTALLVSVGCRSDAYEQANGFGDDIAAKSGKYSHELGNASGALAVLRLVGSGNPPLQGFRVGLEFAVSGRRDLDGMIVQHAALARGLAEKLGLSPSVQMALGACPGSSRAASEIGKPWAAAKRRSRSSWAGTPITAPVP